MRILKKTTMILMLDENYTQAHIYVEFTVVTLCHFFHLMPSAKKRNI